MTRLQADFPNLIIVHFTAPLTAEENGLKARIKRLIGRKINSDADNAAREAYNRKLRAEYTSKAPVFDLALVEASDSNGFAVLHSSGDSQYYALRAEYTDDGGHLNAVGRKRAASWLAAELGKSLR
jgi:lysophospholipase L1-like esterase